MPERNTHPTAQALALFGQGRLSDAQAATVAAHLETCDTCRHAVADLPPDTFLGKVRAAQPGASSLPPSPSPGARGRPPPSAPPAGVPPELANHPKFRVVRELGRGGMGVIYLAEHRVLEKRVALKVISPAMLDNPDALARFHREAKAAASLDHPNIARAYDADQAGPLHFLVMEYVEGQSLAQLLEKRGSLPVAHACHYVRQAALGLQHASEQGMVHRDIKPQNLMLTPKGLVKVLDFGLARLRSERKAAPRLTQLESFMGTPEYMAPEQAMDAREADTRADIYSLGCTLYALLTGRPPFVEETVGKLVLAHVEREPQPPHELRPDVPPDLSEVVGKTLAKDPAQRYQRPIDVAQALVPFIKGGGKPASASVPAAGENGSPFADLGPTPTPTRAAKKGTKGREAAKAEPAARWRRPAVFAGAGAAALALAVGAFLLGGAFPKKVVTLPDTPRSSTEPSSGKAIAGAPQPPPGSILVKSLDMKLVLVPRGTFWMGARGNQKQVTIDHDFYMGVFPVMQGQWQAVMDNNPSYFSRTGGGADKVKGIPEALLKQFPVEQVSWDDVQVFLKLLKVGEKGSGLLYRLPSEAEWEYSCRGGASSLQDCDFDFYFAQPTNDLSSEQANFDGNFPAGNAPKGPYLGRTTKVGSYQPNRLGLYDMHGNVWEWCADPWEAGGSARVRRGGCWMSAAGDCRASLRSNGGPALRRHNVGFRLAAVPSGE